MSTTPVIPETIVVHLGAPDSNAENIRISFPEYIKNVASSEIYPTWPKEALRANILAQISVALNRVYTQFYRSRGYNFDITSSPAYDQTFVYQRDIFANISEIVDEIFDSYIRKDGNVEPLYAEFCDGVEINCNGLEQWGSVTLAEQGLGYLDILKRYYGDDISVITNVPVGNIPPTYPSVVLSEGDTGREVELLQRRLNRISANFPGIPKISPDDGFFGKSTTDAVKKFQEVFGLTPDGLVGRATWIEIQAAYNAVKRLYAVNSEGLKLEDLDTRYSSDLSEGDRGDSVLTLQYFLNYISLFVASVLSTDYDGVYGPSTATSVRSFQRTYGLDENGIVNRETWDKIEGVYYDIISGLEQNPSENAILPYPGRILAVGSEGDDVRVLQQYLNFISNTYQTIPKLNVDGLFGTSTARAVSEFKKIFNIPGNPERVNAPTWNAIASIYDDLYTGTSVNEGQFPGYEIS